MALAHNSFRIDSGRVAHELFEGEVLAINLETGTYYSLTGASGQLWSMLAEGLTATDIVGRFVQLHDDPAERITAAVHEFLDRLCSERLIVGNDEGSPAEPASTTAPPESRRTPLPAFEIKVFTDMQDLLLLDPIHDVEDSGWPMGNPQGTKPDD